MDFLIDGSIIDFLINRQGIGPGIFHKLTGALSSQGLQILSAEIHTLADGLVFDRFNVNDTDFAGSPTPASPNGNDDGTVTPTPVPSNDTG